MKRNMGTADRIIRLLVVALIAALYFGDFISGTIALVLGIIAVIFAITSFLSFCPLYAPFGFITCAKKEK